MMTRLNNNGDVIIGLHSSPNLLFVPFFQNIGRFLECAYIECAYIKCAYTECAYIECAYIEFSLPPRS